MRKSNNYFKFLEYVTFGKDHDDAIDKGNGVMECKSYVSISDIEYRYNTTFGLENAVLTLKNILINKDTIYVYYLENENSTLVKVYLLDDFKTQKELKNAITTACTEFLYGILLEKSESRETNNAIKGHIIADDNSSYNIEVLRAKQDLNTKYGNSYRKYLYAIMNPNWHHVSLATLANIDFDMLDEKRKVYLSFYKKWKEARKNLRKCSCGHSYERCYRVFRKSLIIALDKKEISAALVDYFDRQISMINVECGVWSSAFEVAMGQHDSRKYKRATLRY